MFELNLVPVFGGSPASAPNIGTRFLHPIVIATGTSKIGLTCHKNFFLENPIICFGRFDSPYIFGGSFRDESLEEGAAFFYIVVRSFLNLCLSNLWIFFSPRHASKNQNSGTIQLFLHYC